MLHNRVADNRVRESCLLYLYTTAWLGKPATCKTPLVFTHSVLHNRQQRTQMTCSLSMSQIIDPILESQSLIPLHNEGRKLINEWLLCALSLSSPSLNECLEGVGNNCIHVELHTRVRLILTKASRPRV
jgi:hypothetical protein